MRMLTWFGVVAFVTFAIAPAASARVVRMESAVALADHSGPTVEEALKQAFDTAVTGARAMGLPTMRVNDALILADAVIVLVVATDEKDADIEDDEDEDDDDILEMEPTLAPLAV